jgi:hypothetical protein
MKAFLLGAVVGGLMVWRWRDEIQQYLEAGRARAAQGLEAARQTAEDAVERARPRVQSAVRTGQGTGRPAESGPGAGLSTAP